jgi:glutamate synthase (NADPH) small chain
MIAPPEGQALMEKRNGYLEIARADPGYRPVVERVRDFDVIEERFTEDAVRRQALRCMDCGTPFCCASGCPIRNLIPEFNEMVAEGRWRDALELLLANSSMPEFTAAICPAPCEESCVLAINDQPVSIRQIEREIIETGFERGWIAPMPPEERNGFKVAVVGSGPAGLAVAQKLNRLGCTVTIYEAERAAGGLLRYGIPDYKLPKWMLERRIDLMRSEGVIFETGTRIGADISRDYLLRKYDAVCLTGGARRPRDLDVPGRELDGIHFAMDYLTRQNRLLAGEDSAGAAISAAGKRVVVIGGGDTGSDCIGTALRQGALDVCQLEIMPRPPERALSPAVWPAWPNVLRESSSQSEGCTRRWSVATQAFVGDDDGAVRQLDCVELDWDFAGDRPSFRECVGSEFSIEAELVLLAMGFLGPDDGDLQGFEGLERDSRGNVWTDGRHMTRIAGIFCAGDMQSGQSLVVRAMDDGRRAALDILDYLINI